MDKKSLANSKINLSDGIKNQASDEPIADDEEFGGEHILTYSSNALPTAREHAGHDDNSDNILADGAPVDLLEDYFDADSFATKDMGTIDTIDDFRIETDALDLSDLLESLDYGGFDPISDGLISIEQQGSDTVILLHELSGAATPTALAVLQNVLASDIDQTQIVVS